MFASKMLEKGSDFDASKGHMSLIGSWCSRRRRCWQRQIVIGEATIAAEFPGEVIVGVRLVFV